ncbi:MAG: hypothetical protein GXP31_09040 [Kiritimatiellaeota bacterium]|nr:hypothetical protein [Kiritimatiellota bacterium]
MALQLEGIAPRVVSVSFVRPMYWQMERCDPADREFPDAPPELRGDRVVVPGNIVPLSASGLWLGRTRVFNPSGRERTVRICTPSNFPVRVWLNGVTAVDNPGSERIMPSYHANAAHHYGAGVLHSGWNEVRTAWLRPDGGGETHFFLTDPDGRGWGDLVFET